MHGGDIYRNKVQLDFSVNVNPLGVPESVMQIMREALLQVDRYPDLSCENLKKSIAEYFQVIPERILCGNGASELITTVCRWKMPQKGIVTGPGFSGYCKALEGVFCEMQIHYLKAEKQFVPGEELLEQVEKEKADILFLANPSNPTGVLLDRKFLEKLLLQCQKTNTTVVLDECFMELTGQAENCSMSREEDLRRFDNLLIVRAFTKSFAIPGIRLGYLLCGNVKTAMEIEKQLPEWNVSVIAQAAGVAALKCKDYIRESVAYIAKEREKMAEQLVLLGAAVIPSKANYLLFQWPGDTLYEQLLQKGILIRDCSDYAGLTKGYYRVAVRKAEENAVLLQAMRDL